MTRLFIATLLAGAGLSQAATTFPPSCGSFGNLALLQSAGTCSIGVFTVKDVFFSATDEGVNASDFILTPVINGSSIQLSLSGSPFAAGSAGLRIFTFGFTIDPPPDIIKGISAEIEEASFGVDSFTTAATGDAVLVDYVVCAGFAFSDGCAGDLFGFSLNVAQRVVADTTVNGVTFVSPVNTVGVQIQVTLDGGGFGALTSGFPLVEDVPEPGTMGMMGLLAVPAILALRRRRAARRP